MAGVDLSQDFSHRSICSIVLGSIFDTKVYPSLKAGRYESMRRVDDENDEMAPQLTFDLLLWNTFQMILTSDL